MKYITLLAGFGLIGTIIYFGLQPAPIEKQPVTEVIEQVITEPTSPKIEPKATVTPKKAKVPIKVEKVAPSPTIVPTVVPTVVVQEQPKPIEQIKVVEAPKEEPKPEVKPDFVSKWEIETTFERQDGWTKAFVKGYPTWSNGIGVTYFTKCKLIWRRYLQPSGVLYSEEFYPMTQIQSHFEVKVDLKYDEYVTTFTQCQTFNFDKQGNEVTFKSPEIKN